MPNLAAIISGTENAAIRLGKTPSKVSDSIVASVPEPSQPAAGNASEKQSTGSGARAPATKGQGSDGAAKPAATVTKKARASKAGVADPTTVPLTLVPKPVHYLATMEQVDAAGTPEAAASVLTSLTEFMDGLAPIQRVALTSAVRGQAAVSGNGSGNNCFPTALLASLTGAATTDPSVVATAKLLREATVKVLLGVATECNAQELAFLTNGTATEQDLRKAAADISSGGMYTLPAMGALLMALADAGVHVALTVHGVDGRRDSDGKLNPDETAAAMFTSGDARLIAPVSANVAGSSRTPSRVTLMGQHYYGHPDCEPGAPDVVRPGPYAMKDLQAKVQDLHTRLAGPGVVTGLVANNRSIGVTRRFKFLCGSARDNGLDAFFGDVECQLVDILRVARRVEPALVDKAAAEALAVTSKELAYLEEAAGSADTAAKHLAAVAPGVNGEEAGKDKAVSAFKRVLHAKHTAEDLRLKAARLRSEEALRRARVSASKSEPFTTMAARVALRINAEAARAAAEKAAASERARQFRELAAARAKEKAAKLRALTKAAVEEEARLIQAAIAKAKAEKAAIEKARADSAGQHRVPGSPSKDEDGHVGKKRTIDVRTPPRPGSVAATTATVTSGTGTAQAPPDEVMVLETPTRPGTAAAATAGQGLGLLPPPPTFALGTANRGGRPPPRAAAKVALNGIRAATLAEEDEPEAGPTQPVEGPQAGPCVDADSDADL